MANQQSNPHCSTVPYLSTGRPALCHAKVNCHIKQQMCVPNFQQQQQQLLPCKAVLYTARHHATSLPGQPPAGSAAAHGSMLQVQHTLPWLLVPQPALLPLQSPPGRTVDVELAAHLMTSQLPLLLPMMV